MTQPPSLDLDPFSIEFFENPHPVHEVLREAGPVVRLDKWNVYGVARYAEVHAVLNDPATFCSSRGVGLSDFAREKPWRPQSIILEADPPEHTRTRAVLNRVLSPSVMKQLRGSFVAAAEARVDALLAKGSFDAIPDLAEAYPSPCSRALRAQAGRAREFAALCGTGVQRVRAAEQAAPGRDQRSAPHQAYVAEGRQRENPRPAVLGRASMRGSRPDITPAGPLLVARPAPASIHRQRHWGRDHCLARSRSMGAAACRRSRATRLKRRCARKPGANVFRTTTRDVEMAGRE
jgi:hypothetical protein